MSAHRSKALAVVAVVLACLALPSHVQAQGKKNAKDSTKAPKAPKDSGQLSKFFQSETPITMTLTTNIKRIRGDKSPEVPWRAASFRYDAVAPDTGSITIPARIRTRGIWRLKNCEFPPIRINFTSEAVKGTLLKGLDEPKLVNYCRNNDEFEQYILAEFQLNRVYRLLTPISHAVRLVRLTYADSASGKVEATRWAFIVEDPAAVADRIGGKVLKIKGAMPGDYEPRQSALVGLFQYMIGNTDFALSELHNAELLGLPMGDYLPIAYDFDFSGAVNARYASVDPKLAVKRVRDRLYRGYCVPNDAYAPVIALFNAKKDAIYALYSDSLGKLLKPNTVKETLQYFDEFYRIINDQRAFKNEVVNACLGKA
ncbi:MAG TPA: hypothetical protein VIP11_12055 [Gemmatimonadaceae bacterium]